MALLRTIPMPEPLTSALSRHRPRSVLEMIRMVGLALRREIVVGDFSTEPVGSFTVDAHVSPRVLEMLGIALNVGAIVYVPDPGSAGILISLKGRRFRLSYLVATRFGLPPRLDRSGA